MEVHVNEARLSFNNVFVAEDYQNDKKFKYKAKFLIEKDSKLDKKIRKTILSVLKDKFSLDDEGAEKLFSKIKDNVQKCCYQDGDDDKYDSHDGYMILGTTRRVEDGRPTVIDRDKTPLTQEDGKPYSGCYVEAFLDIYAYDNSGRGVTCSLDAIRFLKDGDAFSGAKTVSADKFSDLSDLGDEDEDDLA